MSKGMIWGTIAFAILAVIVVLMPEPPTPPAPICLVEDKVTNIRDDYNGAWSGVDRSVFWESGAKEIKSGDNMDKYYVGKKVCREYKS